MQNNFEQVMERLDSQGRELAQLKKGMNRWRAATLAAVLGIATLALTGAIKARSYVPAVIRAHKFVLIGPSNRKLAVLSGYPNGVTDFTLYGQSGKQIASLYGNSTSSGLDLYGQSIMPMVTLSADPLGTNLTLSRPSGKPTAEISGGGNISNTISKFFTGLFLFGEKRGYVHLTAAVNPHLTITDVEGFKSSLGVTGLVTPKTGETHQTSAASLVMFNKKGNVIWQAPGY